MKQFLLNRARTGVAAYGPDVPDAIYKLSLLACTQEEIADVLGITPGTLQTWMNKYPEARAALEQGRDGADKNVAERLYQKAMGYSHDEEKIFVNSKGQVTRVNTVKHYPPDTASAIFWLKNRQRTKWRDKHEVEHTGQLEMKQILEDIWDAECTDVPLLEHDDDGSDLV